MSMRYNPLSVPAKLLQLPEAPVFRPTEQEFADPLHYIAGIRAQAEPYGLCRVVPPEGWAPPFAIDKHALYFRTLVQQVQELQERADDPAARAAFKESFAVFQATSASPPKKAPIVSNQDIDLCSLYRAVNCRGGYIIVTDAKAWRDIGRALGVSPTPLTTLCRVPLRHCRRCEKTRISEYRIPRALQCLEMSVAVESWRGAVASEDA